MSTSPGVLRQGMRVVHHVPRSADDDESKRVLMSVVEFRAKPRNLPHATLVIIWSKVIKLILLRVGWWWFGSTAIEIANEYHAVFPTLSPIGFGPGTVCKSFRPEGLDGTRRVIYVYFSEHSHGISKQPIAQGNLPNLYFWVAMQVVSMLLCRSNSPISFNEADIKRDPTRCGEIQYLSRITHTKKAIPRLSRIFLVPVEKPMEIDHSCIKAAPADSSKTCSKCVFSAKQV